VCRVDALRANQGTKRVSPKIVRRAEGVDRGTPRDAMRGGLQQQRGRQDQRGGRDSGNRGGREALPEWADVSIER
jgi:hypothetical protein